MNKLFIIVSVFLFSNFLYSKSVEELVDNAKPILQLIYNDNFEEAKKEIAKLEPDSKNFPITSILKAVMYCKISEEYRTQEYKDDFFKAISSTIPKLENQTYPDPKEEARKLQLLGSIYGYRGIFYTIEGRWITAFKDGVIGHNRLEDSMELNKNLVDNKSAMGVYLYWRSKKSSLFKYLLFWGDKRQEGIAMIKASIDKSELGKNWSLASLIRIYIEEEDWNTAIKYANELLALSPNDVGSHRRKAIALEKLKNYPQAVEEYKKILDIAKNQKMNTSNIQVEAIYNILKLSKQLNIKIDLSYKEYALTLTNKVTPAYVIDTNYMLKKIREF